MWTHSLRMELYPFGIYTSVIEPHLFQTGIFTASKVFVDSIQSNQDKSILKAYNWKKLKNQAMKTNTKFENSGSISFDIVIDTCIHALTGKYPRFCYIFLHDILLISYHNYTHTFTGEHILSMNHGKIIF